MQERGRGEAEIGFQESLHQRVRVRLDLGRRADGEDLAFVQQGDAVRDAEGQVAVVRDDDAGDMQPMVQAQDLAPDGDGDQRIQFAGRFVVEDQAAVR